MLNPNPGLTTMWIMIINMLKAMEEIIIKETD